MGKVIRCVLHRDGRVLHAGRLNATPEDIINENWKTFKKRTNYFQKVRDHAQTIEKCKLKEEDDTEKWVRIELLPQGNDFSDINDWRINIIGGMTNWYARNAGWYDRLIRDEFRNWVK